LAQEGFLGSENLGFRFGAAKFRSWCGGKEKIVTAAFPSLFLASRRGRGQTRPAGAGKLSFIKYDSTAARRLAKAPKKNSCINPLKSLTLKILPR